VRRWFRTAENTLTTIIERIDTFDATIDSIE